jgi:hypothetical protein
MNLIQQLKQMKLIGKKVISLDYIIKLLEDDRELIEGKNEQVDVMK